MNVRPAAVEGAGGESPRRVRLPPRPVSWVVRGEELPGTRYRLMQWLGEGALGIVYEAHHLDIERRVAFKILRADAAGSPAADAFRAEARTVSTIGSPYIVEIYDVGELPDGRAWIAMELLDGHALVGSLDQSIEPARVIAILRQVCKGLATAHDAGVVHRDVKPENIVLTSREGRADAVKLVDFGIAELVGNSEGGLAPTGTPAYMAPEQIAGARVDARSDMYALGCVAYEMLCGRLPFDSPGVEELLHHHEHSTPPPLESIVPTVPRALSQVVMRCLAKQPAQRYADMRDLEAALCEAQIEHGLATAWDDLPLPEVDEARRQALQARMPHPGAIATPSGRRWLWPVVFGVGVGVVGAVLLTLVLTGVLGPRGSSEPGQVDRLATEARDAAARASYVYPLGDDPQGPTAYLRVLELEQLPGDEHERGRATATELRDVFAQTLIQLGDLYWDDQDARPFALDYYAQALLFDPDNEHATQRSLLTPGELAMMRSKATEQTFSARELEAIRPLVALASSDERDRADKLQQIFAEGTRGSLADQRMLCMDDTPLPRDAIRRRRAGGPSTGVAPDDGEALRSGEEALLGEGGEMETDTGTGTGGEADAEASSSGSRRDPAGARRLAGKGTAALNAGRTSEAETLFHRALSLDNRNAEALGGLAKVHFNRGAYQRAMSLGRRAVRSSPRSAKYRVALGDAFFKLFRYTEAREQYRKAKSLGHPQAKDRLAKVESRISGG